MIIMTILMMATIVFVSRYLFLEPRLPLKLNVKMQRLLNYSGPAILTAIWGPIVFLPHEKLWVSFNNPYLLASIVTLLLVWKTGRILTSIAISMVVFMLVNLFL